MGKRKSREKIMKQRQSLLKRKTSILDLYSGNIKDIFVQLNDKMQELRHAFTHQSYLRLYPNAKISTESEWQQDDYHMLLIEANKREEEAHKRIEKNIQAGK